MNVKFNIIPVPASRPRVTRWSTYYGKKYTNFKEEMLSLTSDIVFTPLEGNIFAQLQFNVPIPKSWTKKKKEAKNGAYCDNHADIDNYCKAILDSLNGVYYEDDKQIVMLQATMLWATEASIDCTFTTLDSHSNARFAPMPPMSPFGNN
jgi:Holliday junction resolvase RusA-like endonuclease|tara:strand:+ start:67 stop:513 length:447 start_codon:yes stop_codon:yes gene_type:complete